MNALRHDNALEVLRLMNGVTRTKSHEKRAVKMLIESIERDKPGVTRALPGWGADPNGEQGHYFRTPLVQAARGNRIEHAAALLGAGADVNKVDSFKWTPLHEAHTVQMAALLLQAGADIEAKAS